MHLAAHHVGHRLRAALVRHVRDVHSRHLLEQFARQMTRRAITGRGIEQFTGIGLGLIDEFTHGFDRLRIAHRQHLAAGVGLRDGLHVFQRVVRHLGQNAAIDRQPTDIAVADGVAVGRGTHHHFDADG